MDFFEYTSLVDSMATAFDAPIELWLAMVIGGLCFLIVYIFQAVGLYTIASREGYGHKWMAFVPFFNTYYLGVCGQKNRFFNLDTKKVALTAAIIEAVLFCGYVLYYIAYFNVLGFIETVANVRQTEWGNIVSYEPHVNEILLAEHTELAWARWVYENLDVLVLNWISLVFVFIKIVVLNCFFQTYSARHYFLFTLACIFFPVQGIMVFAVRNNKGMSYAEYMRRVQERMYRQYRTQQNYYQNPYNNSYSGGYQQPPQNSAGQQGEPYSRPPEDPFSEFGSSNSQTGNSDPFDEFKN